MSNQLPHATLIYTEVRNFHSTAMDSNYQISTWVPHDYPKMEYKYPVIYLLDAEVQLGMVSAILWRSIIEQEMPDCIIIGVGHNISTLDEWLSLRDIDFTPEENPEVATPKRAAEFLSFLKNELIPFIENTYPVETTDRCLIGYSASGGFALYALLHEPELFQKYFISSGIWPTMLPIHISYEKQLAKKRKSLPAHVLFSVGSLESDQVNCLHQFIDILKNRNYMGLCLETMVIEGRDHLMSVPVAYCQGLKALYKPHN